MRTLPRIALLLVLALASIPASVSAATSSLDGQWWGGFALPLRSMPTPIQWVTELFPATHYIRLSRDVYLRGEGFFGVLPDLAVLAVFGTFLAALALRTIGERT